MFRNFRAINVCVEIYSWYGASTKIYYDKICSHSLENGGLRKGSLVFAGFMCITTSTPCLVMHDCMHVSIQVVAVGPVVCQWIELIVYILLLTIDPPNGVTKQICLYSVVSESSKEHVQGANGTVVSD